MENKTIILYTMQLFLASFSFCVGSPWESTSALGRGRQALVLELASSDGLICPNLQLAKHLASVWYFVCVAVPIHLNANGDLEKLFEKIND